MEMKHVTTEREIRGRFKNPFLNVKQVEWGSCKPGDQVYIAGLLVDGFPTCIHGPHEVVDQKNFVLKNIRSKRTFYERYNYLFKKMNPIKGN